MEIPVRKRLEVVKLYLDGLSYDDTVFQTGVSKGSVVNIIREFKEGQIPGLETAKDKANELHELAVRLKKLKLRVGEAAVALRFLDRLNRLGVTPQSLEQWLAMCEGISSSEEERRGLIQGAMRLVGLEAELGQPYPQLLAQVQGRRRELEKLTEHIEKARETKAALDRERAVAKAGLASALGRLEGLIKTEDRLNSVGLEKVARLAQFAQECEALGFEAGRVKQLAHLEKEMVAAGITPGRLRGFLKEKGSLVTQIGVLTGQKQVLEELISGLGWKRRTEEELLKQAKNENATLLQQVEARVTLRCKFCSAEVVLPAWDPDRYREMMRSNQSLTSPCPQCRRWSSFSPWEVLAEVGLGALEAKIILGNPVP